MKTSKILWLALLVGLIAIALSSCGKGASNSITSSLSGELNTGDDVDSTGGSGDLDSDGIADSADSDIDGDGIINTEDDDIDGDGIANEDDADIDGDGVVNTGDNDIDGDGIANDEDDDMDGDGIPNDEDTDADGDGIADSVDSDTNSDGIADSDSSTGTVVAFSATGIISVEINSTDKTGNGSKYVNFDEIRDSADEHNADLSTLFINGMYLGVSSEDSLLMASYGSTTLQVIVFYVLDGDTLQVAQTSASSLVSVSTLLQGVDLTSGLQINQGNYSRFQTLVANESYSGVTLYLEFINVNGDLPDETIEMDYTISATAEADL
ncbi:MAG TPA: hypothetical protein VLM37_05540 [Fibrobacteraceae bacterium]|nr:hypothetical protein [Fibrobacteraceae bacterium]